MKPFKNLGILTQISSVFAQRSEIFLLSLVRCVNRLLSRCNLLICDSPRFEHNQ
ncbi:uncharacterized protein [Blastocystis hominis]|uniref:Uncharacterized protein n=1 Tax=Blastocystis hominis TaxID=12968 RepID=D8MB28_BLAHO|nr:uncharacterized protein [Blastocystis hominis]CBK25267.2 unnamed protein product [Blastocystis hominis]|eukprot:XP_012899315.1 uncharacterized protein [Blastocystis hominis]